MRDRCRTDHGAELALALEHARERLYRARRPDPAAGVVLTVEPCRAVRPPADDLRHALADFAAAGFRLETFLDAHGEPVEAGAWAYSLTLDGRLTTYRRANA